MPGGLYWLQHQAFQSLYGTGSSPAAPDAFATVMAAKAPTAWWRLGESAGATAADEMSVQAGTYTGTPTLGAAGYTGDGDTGITLDGTNYVSVADNAAWDVGTADFSLMAAASIASWPVVHQKMIVRGNGAGTGDYDIFFNQYATNRVTFRLAGTSYHFDTGVTIAGSGMRLYGLSVDRSGLATLTIDGGSVGTLDVSAQVAANVTGSRVLGLGADAFTPQMGMVGTLDECALWNGTLLSVTDWQDIHASRSY